MQSNEIQVAILGAGPAGIFAALTLSQKKQFKVSLFDINQRPGRKFSQTGSGRCNITNMFIRSEEYFSGGDLTGFLERYPPEKIRKVLSSYGIATVETENGWVYPSSFSGTNVTEILANRLTASSVIFFGSTKVQNLSVNGKRFHLRYFPKNTDFVNFDALILASGSKAFPQLSADDSIFSSLSELGIKYLPFRPALAGLLVAGKALDTLSGVRLDAEVTLLACSKPLKTVYGNLIFTSRGVNGPAVMNLSHLLTDPKNIPYQLFINFLSNEAERFIAQLFKASRHRALPLRDLFLSCLPAKLTDFILAKAGVRQELNCTEIDSGRFRKILNEFKTFQVPVQDVEGFRSSQCCCGGVSFEAFTMPEMESKQIPGLFFAGEMVDVNGPCGGYNLHWAIASGIAAAEGCIRRFSTL